jgi:NitT/TauT family transport system permease protein
MTAQTEALAARQPGPPWRPRVPWRPLLGLALFLLIWESVPAIGLLPASLLPPPSAIPRTFWREIVDGHWLPAVGHSLRHYALGLVIGTAGGVGLGVAIGLSRALDDGLSWIVRTLRPIPGLAWVPFAILWFGVSPAAAVFIIAIGVFWINLFASAAAVQAVDRDLIELADAFGRRTRLSKLIPVILPAAAPGILAGIRTGIGQAWMAVVAAELFGVPGIGQRMIQAASLIATEIVVVCMLTMAALYGLMDALFLIIQARVMRWQG